MSFLSLSMLHLLLLFQLELIKLQSDDTLKVMYLSEPLFEFYRVLIQERFSKLDSFHSQMVICFQQHVAYTCKQFFSNLNITKSRYISRLPDENPSSLRSRVLNENKRLQTGSSPPALNYTKILTKSFVQVSFCSKYHKTFNVFLS